MWEKYRKIVSHIAVGSGVVDTVADWVKHQGKYKKILIVCDPNTYRVAGERVIASLKDAGLDIIDFCFPEDEPLPDEYSVGRIVSAFTPDIDLIAGVGSGTINDLCTYVGSKVGRPSIIVATAPSMDGYASLGSAMLFEGVKITPMTQCPAAIFCDIDILSAAPVHMIAAGLGDMLGKITSLADWRLSHVLTGEPMPCDIAGIMEGALDKVIASIPGAARRAPAAIRSITEGLILSGIAMSLYGDSRPASGTEHHLAHFWEMRMLAEGRKPALHGTKVAVAAVLGLEMWRKLADELRLRLLNLTISGQQALHSRVNDETRIPNSQFSQRRHDAVLNSQLRIKNSRLSFKEQEIRRLYGATADAIMQTENPNLAPHNIKGHLHEILDIASSLPAPEDIADELSSVGITMRLKDINLDADTLQDSVIYARERKKTYTLLQLLGDLGLLDGYAAHASEYFGKSALSGIKCFVLDMDGTIYLGNKLFPYIHGFLEHLNEHDIDYVFFTNNSSQNASHYIDKLHSMGIPVSDDKLMMSTHVLLDYLDTIYSSRLAALSETAHNGAEAELAMAVFVAGTQALKDDFTDAGYILTEEKPEFCVLGFDTDMDYNRLTKLCDFIRGGVPVYGVNMDYNCPAPEGFVPDCGSLAAAVHASTGVMPEFFGKPSRRALEYIIEKTGHREDELCFVGDRLYTDIAITDGSAARSVLVLSGETKREDLAGSPYIPDVIARDLQELQERIT